jgi:CheY-like chemotaxis protein/HPt (histidine-containing phosphotransfer) domain-containing protein
MNGLAALAGLAAQPDAQDLPATLLLWAAEHEHEHERDSAGRLEHAGLAEHTLAHPVNAAALFNAVNASLARRHGGTSRVLQATRLDSANTLWLADMRVLLVDDSEINLEVARRLLECRGARVQTCTSGSQALDCLRARPADFDAVLMDVQMPDMDGLEATRRIRTECGAAQLPVIALTAGALVEERRRALEAGMQDFLSKPLDPTQLIRVLRRCVEAARGAVLPVKEGAFKRGPAAAAAAWPQVAGIDVADVAARLGHDLPLFLCMLRQLLLEFRDLAQVPECACDVGDPRRLLAARLHKLRGSASTVGAHELHRLAGLAEASLKDTHNQTQAQAHTAVLAVSVSLAQLAAQSAAALARQPPDADAPSAAESSWTQPLPPATAARVQPLLQQLRRQDLAALDSFNALLPALRGAFGTPAVEALSNAMDALDFTQALDLLAAKLAAAAPAGAAPCSRAVAITD